MADTRGIRAGRAFVELGVSDKLTAALKRAQARLSAFGGGVQSIGLKIAALGGAVLAPFAGAVKQFSAYGDTLDKMAIRTGVAVETLSELRHAAELSGSSLQTFEKGVKKMQMTINDASRGLSTAVDALDAIGLSFEQLQGLSPEEQFKAIAEGISRIEDPSKRAAVAQQILGRAGTELLPLMQNGAKGIEELQKAARDLGLTVSTETAKEAALLTDTLGTLFTVMKNGVFVVGSALAPAVTKIVAATTTAVVAAVKWVKENKAVVVTVAKVAAITLAAGLAIAALGTGIVLAGSVLGSLATIITAIGAAIGALLSPLGLVTAAFVAGTIAFFRFTAVGRSAIGKLAATLGVLKATAEQTFSGIRDALMAGRLDLAVKVVGAGISVAWREAMNDLYGSWIDVRSKILGSMVEWWTGLQSLWAIGAKKLLETWANLKFGAITLWNDVTDYTAKKLLEIQGLFDDTLDVDAAKQIIDDTARRREQGQLDALNEQLDSIQSGFEDRLGRYVDEERRLKDAIEQNAGVDLQRYQDALNAAKKELADAMEQAKAAREAAGESPTINAGDRSIADIFDELAGQLSSKLEVRGTFNAAAVQSLRGSQSSPEERTAELAEAISKHTKRLVDAVVGNKGLVFSGG